MLEYRKELLCRIKERQEQYYFVFNYHYQEEASEADRLAVLDKERHLMTRVRKIMIKCKRAVVPLKAHHHLQYKKA